MEKSEIAVGDEYAYLVPGAQGPHEPLRAVVTSEPEGGYVEVTLYHPDNGQSEERVKTREIVGRWDDEPEARYSQHRAQVESVRERGGKWTWRDVALKRYADVQRQRSLADRLSRLNIRRAGRPYAGQGGTSRRPHDTDLKLALDEIEYLLTRAETGPSAVAPARPSTSEPDFTEA